MCVIRDTTKAIIKQLVGDQETFTAYDVTEEVRSKMLGTTVYHYKLRDFIHSEMQEYIDDGEYDKEQDFSKHPNGPFMFSPVGDIPPPSIKFTPASLIDLVKLVNQYGKKPHNSTQPNRKFWNVRDSKGKFTKVT